MFLEKIEQLIAVLEKQELEVIELNWNWIQIDVAIQCAESCNFFVVSFCLQSPNGIVSPQLYAELFAAYLYKNDL